MWDAIALYTKLIVLLGLAQNPALSFRDGYAPVQVITCQAKVCRSSEAGLDDGVLVLRGQLSEQEFLTAARRTAEQLSLTAPGIDPDKWTTVFRFLLDLDTHGVFKFKNYNTLNVGLQLEYRENGNDPK